jgi:hypothetical protein
LAFVAWSALAMSGARAEVAATDCSIAIRGTTAFSSQTIHCLSEDQIGRVIDVLVKRGGRRNIVLARVRLCAAGRLMLPSRRLAPEVVRG